MEESATPPPRRPPPPPAPQPDAPPRPQADPPPQQALASPSTDDFTADAILNYGQRYATLAVPTPAGREAVALLESFARSEDADLIALHRAGEIRLVELGSVDFDAVIIDGRAYHGIAVTATRARIEDFADFTAQVQIHHGDGPLAGFVASAVAIAAAAPSPDAALAREARRFLAAEWDRIRGVLPPEQAGAIAPRPPPPPPVLPGLPPTFAPLLRQLCDRLEEEPRPAVGRPRMPIGDVAFAVVLMVATGSTGRAAARDLVGFFDAGFIAAPVHFNTLLKAMTEPRTARALAQLVTMSEAMLASTPTGPVVFASRAKLQATREIEGIAAVACRNLRLVAGQ